MLAFQQYQIAFTAHIRDPKRNPKPARVKDSRMAIYREIVFNNIISSVSACFPVCINVLGKRKWQQLCRAFFAQHQASSPLFREIPEAFLSFLNTQDLTQLKLPTFLTELAHYEWAELAVSNMPEQKRTLSADTDLLNECPILTNAHFLLEYNYPVHTISKRIQPATQTKTYILMFRNSAFRIRFIALNAMTFQLLNMIKFSNITGREALQQIATALNHPQPEVVINFGIDVLNDLMLQNAVLGSAKAKIETIMS
ncbi:MAG: putative DNA-binding domain-containing protein [Methylophilus sp.]|nr:putative DNA-binding domain-containing protein [Methylophilus sp.]